MSRLHIKQWEVLIMEPFDRDKEEEFIASLEDRGRKAMEEVVTSIFKDDVSFLEATKAVDLAHFFMTKGDHDSAVIWLIGFRHRKDIGVTPEKFARLILSFCRHTTEWHPAIEAAGIMRTHFLDDEAWEENSVFDHDDDEDIITALIMELIDDGDREGARNALLLLSGIIKSDFQEYLETVDGKTNSEIAKELKKKAIMIGPSIIALKLIDLMPDKNGY